VWIYHRVAQGSSHPLDQRIRHGMLQPLGLLVHSVPGVSQEFDQVSLDEPMAANHSERRSPAFVGELHAAIGHVLQQTMLRQALDHAGNRRR
jgi:hypothetical protein